VLARGGGGDGDGLDRLGLRGGPLGHEPAMLPGREDGSGGQEHDGQDEGTDSATNDGRRLHARNSSRFGREQF
jgi:hypothetical protein